MELRNPGLRILPTVVSNAQKNLHMKKTYLFGLLILVIICCEKEHKPYLKFGTEQIFDSHIEIPVEWENDNAILSGTLFLPVDSGIYTTLVYVHGSGKEERMKYDVPTEMVRYPIAKEYTDNGYAVFSYDKRGVGQSGGNFNGFTDYSNYSQLGKDALSALQIIKKHPQVKSNSVGFIGASQAGWTIPIIAKTSDEISFIIIINGPTNSNGEEVLFSQLTQDDPLEAQYNRDCSCINLDSIYDILEFNRQQEYDYWGYSSYDDLTLMEQPSLFILGLNDLSVPARLGFADLTKIKNEFNKNWTIKTFEDADHFLLTNNARCVFWSGGKLTQELHYQVDWKTPVFNWLDENINN